MPSVDGNAKRDTSGLGGSILMTSAPRSCSVLAHKGPARTREKSTTRIPLRGPLMSAPRELCETGTILAIGYKTGLEILRPPYRRLHSRHCFVGGRDALVDCDICEFLGGSVCDSRPLRKLLRDGHRRSLQGLFGDR